MVLGPRVTLNAPSPSVEKLKAAMAEPCRVVGLGCNFFGDYPAVYGLEDIRSCAPLSSRPFIELVKNFPGISLHDNDWQMLVTDPVQAQPLLNLLNVRYLLARPDAVVSDQVDFWVTDRDDFVVVENPEAWPRAFFAGQIVTASSSQDFIRRLLASGQKPFIALAPEEILRQPGLERLETTPSTPVIPATHYELGVNATAFDIHAPSAGAVCLTEGQGNDFTVQINGQNGHVLAVNRAFKGVYLDRPGDYHIVFAYRPRYWMAACLVFWISLFAALLMAGMGFCRECRKAI